ncbi:MAG: fasciclin domain-containing protein, partial [Bacteroidia bacterium]
MKKILFSLGMLFSVFAANAQTVVDVVVNSPNHTYLEAAVIQAGLADDLAAASNITLFAPDDQAFEALATALNTDVAGLLALPNLEDILLYHVLGAEVLSVDIVNGAIVNPLST